MAKIFYNETRQLGIGFGFEHTAPTELTGSGSIFGCAGAFTVSDPSCAQTACRPWR